MRSVKKVRCSVDGCKNEAALHGFCIEHLAELMRPIRYKPAKRTATVEPEETRAPGRCKSLT